MLLVALAVLFTLLGTLVWAPGDHGNTFLLAGSGDATISYSSDAETWSESVDEDGNTPFGDAGNALAVNWGRGLWVVGGVNDDTPTKPLAWSVDGKTWTYGTGSNFGSTSESLGRVVRYADGIWVAGGTTATSSLPKILWSSDGKAWNNTTGGAFGTGSSGTCSEVFYGGGLWLATGNDGSSGAKIWWSNNGKNWNAATGSPFGTAANDSGGRFAYGNSRYVNGGTNTTTAGEIMWYSDNGKAWTAGTHPFGDAVVYDVEYYGGIFVAGASWASDGDNILAYSTDGITFTAATGQGTLASGFYIDKILPPTDGFWLALGYDATEQAGLIYRSTDGMEWTKLSLTDFFPGPNSLIQTGITGKYNGNFRTVVAGKAVNSTNIYWTEDGETFTAANNSPFGETISDIILEARWAPVPN